MIAHNIAWIVAGFVAFAVVHSLTAGIALPNRMKHVLDPRLVEGWYRFTYNAFSLVTFMPVLYLLATLPDVPLYNVGQVWRVVFRLAQVMALGGVAWALWSIDFWRFVGLRQVWAFALGEPLPLPEEALQRRGIYSLMRHPLYVFSLVILWASPVMTLNGLVFNVCSTVYFVLGGALEERRMESAFGDKYRLYRRQVNWLFSRPDHDSS